MPEAFSGSSERHDAAYGKAARDEGLAIGGLDGATPVGFLAGLGVQRVLADQAGEHGGVAPRLSWRLLDAWRPVVHGPSSLEDLVEAIHADKNVWESAPLLDLRYVKVEKQGPKTVSGLRVPIAVLRHWLTTRRDDGDESALRYACALVCETVSDPIENAPTLEQLRECGIGVDSEAPLDRTCTRTFFDFTARNAQFLEQIEKIRSYLDRDLIEQGLRSGREDAAAPRSMDWDPAADTPGAIYTGYTRGFLPVAEWLAFRGLVCLPVAGARASVRTTACSGRRLAGHFVWPLWTAPVGPETARSLVAYPRLDRLDEERRRALGIALVLMAELTKKADGYSGMFAPSRPT